MITLKYGCNPHQKPAKIDLEQGIMPIKVRNGQPGYINFMDALNAWQLVREMKQTLHMPAAASFKHVSPAGAAIGLPLDERQRQACGVNLNMDLSESACAYARARGADRMASFGDWAAFSDELDESAAMLLKTEVSDGVIAPSYTKKALEILKTKKKGNYNVVQMDPDYEPPAQERRNIFGVTFEQKRNDYMMTEKDLEQIVTRNKTCGQAAKRDMLLAMITLKYTQSNSVCYVYDGQVIGNGAGQQARIYCTRLAGDKADVWFLRRHPSILELPFKPGLSRADKDNAIDTYLREDVTDKEYAHWLTLFTQEPTRLTKEKKKEWLASMDNVTLGSDAFFPFRDNIDRAAASGVRYIAQPGGSLRDDVVIQACDEYDMVMALTSVRLFHH